ncbi:MAG: hypothetical protein HYR91_00635 [Flavobacteriia bacterium]|nr:hypothetical protein [Flavobacteriia bacterium]
MKLIFLKFVPIITCVLLTSCTDNSDIESQAKDSLDPNSSLNTNFDGKIFSIPSPIQMAILLKETKLPFNESLLNKIENRKKYITEHQQALNLGVYGTDLGYASLNEQNGISLKYLSIVEGITSNLGLESAFDKNFISRFEKYHTNNDSVMHIIADAFRKGDNFLKNSQRKSTSALILTGGWVESMHYACQLNALKANEKIITRIGEQKQTLSTIIEILSEYNKTKENDKLIESLSLLDKMYEKVIIDYQYVKPKTDSKNKITTLQHISSVKIEKALLIEITTQIQAIRDLITN